MKKIQQLLINSGIKESSSGTIAVVLTILLIVAISVAAFIIANSFVAKLLTKYMTKSKSKWSHALLNRKVFHKINRLIPGIVLYLFADSFEKYVNLVQRGAVTYILLMSIFVISAFIDAIDDFYRTFPISKNRPIKGLLQVVKIIVFIIFVIIIIATVLDQNPVILLSSIGVMSAVLTLVFKDSILGFVAGVQLSSNDMLRIGDWIEMPKYGADGDVIDITLNTVKVQNWDKTITTIPAYALVSDSFKNWRGMFDLGGRRIKRSIYIDVNSIKFCTKEMLDKYKKIKYISEYIHNKEEELAQYNKERNYTEDDIINGRHLTNIGTFRAYVTGYLENNPHIHKTLVKMVRQLAPGENGLPLEIYAFTSDTKWVNYERIQSDLFDHILAVVKEFDLKIFQNPTGGDFRQILQ
ncbi:MAG TPA: mechanosensitive ion channel protein MscS [Clostridiales bacterium]|nr:mechanosensitive ion channel protein MscS [Clostridiales bacterium]